MFHPKYFENILKTKYFFLNGKMHYDSIFFTTGRYQQYSLGEKQYHNPFFHPYISLFSNPLIFESSYRFKIKQPRKLEQNTYLADYFTIMSTIRSYHTQLKKVNDKKISEFIKIVCSSFSISEAYPSLFKKIKRRFYAAPILEDYVDKIVNRVDSSIAFVHCGSYLSDSGIIIKRLKENGFVTVELQHGAINADHFAYRYPGGSANNIAKLYLPDYLLTFGRYWCEQTKTPSIVQVVGNPLLNNTKKNIERKCTPVPKSILMISQGTVTSTIVGIAIYLTKEFPDYKIFFKLHPGEIPFIDRYRELSKYSNIEIRTYEDIYELIAKSEIIVGYNSTTLFEAIAFGNKRIFIIDNAVIPDSLGNKFSSNEELRDMIIDRNLGHPSANPDEFWEPNWEANISTFLKEISH